MKWHKTREGHKEINPDLQSASSVDSIGIYVPKRLLTQAEKQYVWIHEYIYILIVAP